MPQLWVGARECAKALKETHGQHSHAGHDITPSDLAAVLGPIVQLFLIGGAAAALAWVLLMLTGGKLHTHSEVLGLQQDKALLFSTNATLSTALGNTNQLLDQSQKAVSAQQATIDKLVDKLGERAVK